MGGTGISLDDEIERGLADRMLLLKHRQYTYAVIDDDIIKLINTHWRGTFAGKSVLRGTQSLCDTLNSPFVYV